MDINSPKDNVDWAEVDRQWHAAPWTGELALGRNGTIKTEMIVCINDVKGRNIALNYLGINSTLSHQTVGKRFPTSRDLS